MGNQYPNHRALLGLAVAAALSVWTAAAAQGLDISGFTDRVLVLLNEQRAANGLSPLQRVSALDAAAQSYSQTMMLATAGGPVYLSHTGPDGSTLARRIAAAGYAWNTLAEDLGAGQKTSPVYWSTTSIMIMVPLQASYPDVGSVTVTLAGQTATGPDFTTVPPPNLTPLRPTSGPPSASGSGAGSGPAPASPTIGDL